MIQLLQNQNSPVQPRGSVATKIAADLFAYGTGYPFLTAWQQLNGQNRQTALLCQKDSALLLSVKSHANLQELIAFTQAVGGQFLQVQGPWPPQSLKAPRRFYEYCLNPPPANGQLPAGLVTQQECLKACYQILYREPSPDLAPVEFNSWYADLSHKIRHGAAFCAVLNGAAVVVSHLYGGNAVISGVAVQKALRRGGRGRRLLAALPALLPKVQQFYVCCSPQTQAFYTACGFGATGKTVLTGRL